jgi:cholesterol oxidase
MVLEAWANIPTTAHILGGAVIGADPATGVVDAQSRLFGYRNFLVCDGSTVPANPGVNPSLTITAMTEYAMSRVVRSASRPRNAVASRSAAIVAIAAARRTSSVCCPAVAGGSPPGRVRRRT